MIRGTAADKLNVRNPDPEGDWFVVKNDGDEETAIEQVFESKAAAKDAANRRKQNRALV